jgi:hypothetical protein
MWWKNVERDTVFTMGHGGQYIIVNKSKNLVITITSEQHTAFEFNLLPDEVISIYDRINKITN